MNAVMRSFESVKLAAKKISKKIQKISVKDPQNAKTDQAGHKLFTFGLPQNPTLRPRVQTRLSRDRPASCFVH
jgi:hypothetical protein